MHTALSSYPVYSFYFNWSKCLNYSWDIISDFLSLVRINNAHSSHKIPRSIHSISSTVPTVPAQYGNRQTGTAGSRPYHTNSSQTSSMMAVARDLSLDVVSELGEEVCHVFHVHAPADTVTQPFQCRFPLVITTRTRVILIDIETSNILFTYDVQALRDSSIIDCLYLAEITSLLILLADSSLVRIPLDNLQSKEEPKVECTELPYQPHKLLGLGSKGIAILFTNGLIYYFSAFKSGTGLPEKPDASKIKPSGNIGKIYCCSNQYHVTFVRESIKTSEYVITSWNNKQLAHTSNKYQVLDDKVGFSHSIKNKLAIVSVTTNHTASYSIIFSANNDAKSTVSRNKSSKNDQVSANHSSISSENLWIKYDLNGSVLFERVLDTIPVSANSIQDKLFILHEGNWLRLWDSKYGVQLCQFNITESAPLNTCIYRIIRNIDSFGPVDDLYHFVCCKPVHLKPHKSADMSYTICSQLIDIPTQINKGNLFSIMGSLRDCSDPIVTSALPTDVTVFASLSRVHRRQLQDAQYKLTKHETVDVDITLQKKRKLYLDVPTDASTAFLTRLNEVGMNVVLQVSDWDVIKLLLKSYTISLTSHSIILLIAYKNHRYDILADIAKYVSDLDENMATKLLQMAINCEEKDIGRMGVRNGILVLRKDKVTTKSTKKNAKIIAADVNDADLVVEDENQDTQLTTPATPLLIVHMIAKALVQRNSAFSSVLLTETLRSSISSQGAVLLIRLYLKFLEGLKYVAGESNDVNQEIIEVKYDELHVIGELNDSEMKRAILWIQCLVDAHFTSLALNVETNVSVRRALVAAMNIVKDCDKSLETLELLAGALEHLRRQNRIRMNEGVVNKSSVYAIETLSF